MQTVDGDCNGSSDGCIFRRSVLEPCAMERACYWVKLLAVTCLSGSCLTSMSRGSLIWSNLLCLGESVDLGSHCKQ